MKTTFYRASLLVAALLLLCAGKAKADTILDYTFAGATPISFELSQTPTPIDVVAGFGFEVAPTNLTINGAPSNDLLIFYSTAGGGAFAAINSSGGPDVSLTGPQLYSGTEANPVMLLISGINLTGFPGTGSSGGSVSNSNPTPEPSGLMLLGFGLVGLVGAVFASKRFGNVLPVAAN